MVSRSFINGESKFMEISRLGSCGFEQVQIVNWELWSDLQTYRQPLCAPTPGPDSMLLICFGKDCLTFDPKYALVKVTASLNVSHYYGKMLLDPISNENIVIGGTFDTSSPYRGERLTENGWVEYLDLVETLPLNYRRFSTAIGPDDTGIFFFSGFAVEESGNGTYFSDEVFNLNSENFTDIVTNPFWSVSGELPVLDIGLNFN